MMLDFEIWSSLMVHLIPILLVVGLAFLIYIIHIWNCQQFFKRRNIVTPKFKLISGNYHKIVENNYTDQLFKWTKKYGSTYGYYEGHMPVLVTSDLSMVEEIFVKKYNHFMARKRSPVQYSDEAESINLGLATKGRWLRMRNIVKNAFTQICLEEMVPNMSKCTSKFIEQLNLSVGQPVTIQSHTHSLTMDIIFKCSFGLDTIKSRALKKKFFKNTEYLFENLSKYKMAILFAIYFYEFKFIFAIVSYLLTNLFGFINIKLTKYANPLYYLRNNIQKIVYERKSSNIQQNDYIQALLDAHSNSFDRSMDNKNTLTCPVMNMTNEEMKMNLVLFVLAGYNTTSTTINDCINMLATHKHEMKKLQSELDEHLISIRNGEKLTLEKIESLNYLDMFIKEVLRMFPIANNVINRRCTSACRIKDIDIPVGLVVAPDVLTFHFSQEYWGAIDTYQFYPQRFSADYSRNALAYMPFGMGPRNCVAYKFVLMQIKLTLIDIIANFDVDIVTNENELCLEASKHIEGYGIRQVKENVQVIFTRRHV